jgi:hypothetical protein
MHAKPRPAICYPAHTGQPTKPTNPARISPTDPFQRHNQPGGHAPNERSHPEAGISLILAAGTGSADLLVARPAGLLVARPAGGPSVLVIAHANVLARPATAGHHKNSARSRNATDRGRPPTRARWSCSRQHARQANDRRSRHGLSPQPLGDSRTADSWQVVVEHRTA